MSPNLQNKIKAVIYASVVNLFTKLKDPPKVGPNFKWSDFPAMCENEVDLWLSLSGIRKTEESILFAKSISYQVSANLVKHATIKPLTDDDFPAEEEAKLSPDPYTSFIYGARWAEQFHGIRNQCDKGK